MNEHHPRTRKSFVKRHSLSLGTLVVIGTFVACYTLWRDSGHLGSFFANSIADWSGSLCVIVATKVFFERGSAQSKPVKSRWENPTLEFLREHSLTIFMAATGIFWLRLFLKADPNSKWGQVYGNMVSEWFQTLGLVWMTKRLIERGSKESN